MHSMLSDDGKEPNTGKGVHIGPKFNEFRGTLFIKKLLIIKREKNSK